MEMTVAQFWWLVLAIGLVVIAVVALLLVLIVQAANRIDHQAALIWTAGKNIAANTVQIWQLQQTNATAGQILATAQTIAEVAESIDGRLERLPGALAGGDRA
jgi:hypothetical protein